MELPAPILEGRFDGFFGFRYTTVEAGGVEPQGETLQRRAL